MRPTAAGSVAASDPGYLDSAVALSSAAADLRLYCFHHGGGAGSAFARWREALSPEIAVLPVQLPGREGRAGVPRIASLRTLVEEVDAVLGPAPTAPFAFYGHSMGGLLAYRLCLRRMRAGRSLPNALLVGGFGPPDQPPDLGPVTALPDEGLARWLIELGGMSPVLLDYPAWYKAAVALTRDDLLACDEHRLSLEAARSPVGRDGTEAEPLPIPVHAFRGTDDPLSARNEEGWARHTTAGCTVRDVPGGHLFAYDDHFTRRPDGPLPQALGTLLGGSL